MITKSSWASARTWAPVAVLMALLVLLQVTGDAGHEALKFERSFIAQGQWWRLLTGSFVHLGWYHLFLNELGLVVLVLLCPEPLPALVWLRRVLLVGLAMGLCLYALVPAVDHYVGMSGVIHGLFVLGLVPQVLQRDLIAAGCLLYLIGKLSFEMLYGGAVADEQALGGPVVLQSHLYGALGAVAYGLAFRAFTRREPVNPFTQSTSKEGEA